MYFHWLQNSKWLLFCLHLLKTPFHFLLIFIIPVGKYCVLIIVLLKVYFPTLLPFKLYSLSLVNTAQDSQSFLNLCIVVSHQFGVSSPIICSNIFFCYTLSSHFGTPVTHLIAFFFSISPLPVILCCVAFFHFFLLLHLLILIYNLLFLSSAVFNLLFNLEIEFIFQFLVLECSFYFLYTF